MAAANALFWTSNGWDGSEDVAIISLEHCTHLPATAHTEIASLELFKTVIVTLQGSSAVVILSRSLTGQYTESFATLLGVDSIFWPFSIIGLVRLCCAFWLTDNYSFSGLTLAEFYIQTDTKIETIRRASFDSLLEQPNIKDKSAEQRFRAISYWPSRAFRIMFFLIISSLLVLSFIWILPTNANVSDLNFTTTSLITVSFYTSILSVTTPIFAFYLFQNRKTTILPCINSPWYKAYTVFIMVFAVVLFIVASIETKITTCGLFTSGPFAYDIASVCSSGGRQFTPLIPRAIQHNTGSASLEWEAPRGISTTQRQGQKTSGFTILPVIVWGFAVIGTSPKLLLH
ncbi:hypothetical protein F4821DRAFT_251176 [Hypoxylon rubiginosum]|uniref:Uncharacterized protein n=1 Tax=Hypoxylon rubiginosum TaxID=110542 RepID=A0ACC0CJS0_9PEZI|nr:hypothetical protein F4821DRAFT_251176 [Hypoxylon rubiginosum]